MSHSCCLPLRFVPLQSVDAPSLQNISFSLTSKHLLAVIGPVGAGKVGFSLAMAGLGTATPALGLTLLCSLPVVAAELRSWRAARRKGLAQGGRSADLRLSAALGLPRHHPQ